MRAVIACVNFDDYLAISLPAWKTVLEPHYDLKVVTAPHDIATQKIAADNHIPVIETKAWYEQAQHDASIEVPFNLAAGFTAGLTGVDDNEICLTLDADIVPSGWMPDAWKIMPDTIYGVVRFDPDGTVAPPANIPYIEKRGRGDSPEACAGYFQLFRYSSERSFGSYPTAATYDYEFAFQFPHGETLTTMKVMHLGERHKNWEGRVSPRIDTQNRKWEATFTDEELESFGS